MANPILSICIPTYNRQKKLQSLLQSIKSGYEKEIEVVIVDDGSEDGTADYCNKLKCNFNLVLIVQKNQGRSSALCNSIKKARGEFIIIMDSDDRFVVGALDTLTEYLVKYESILSEERICGLVFNCVDQKQRIIGKDFKFEGISNFLTYRADESVIGDKKEVVKSNLLKSVLYDPFNGEPRMPTSILWNRLARNHDVITVRSPLAIKEYNEGGMSSKTRELRINSIRSTILYYEEHLLDFGIQYKSMNFAVRVAANFIRYRFHSKSFNLNILSRLTTPQLSIMFLAFPIGFLLFVNDIFYVYKDP